MDYLDKFEITKEIVLKMIECDKIVPKDASLDGQNDSYVEEVCKAYETVYKTIHKSINRVFND
jgi:hypothetical protein